MIQKLKHQLYYSLTFELSAIIPSLLNFLYETLTIFLVIKYLMLEITNVG